MICHTVPFVLLQLGHPLPQGVTPLPFDATIPVDVDLPPGSGGDGWRPASVGSVDSDVHPVRCHWADDVDADRCAIVLAAAEDAWDAQVTDIGFNAPVEDSDGLVDIYLSSEGTGGGAYTYGPAVDSVTGDGKMSSAAYIAIDPSISDDELDGYVVHEFNHVLQYATDFTEPTYMIWESIASAAERWTYPDPAKYEVLSMYAADFQAAPWMGLLGDGYFLWDEYRIWSYYEYGGMVWAFHMDQVYGDGSGSAGAAIWDAAAQEGYTNEPDVLDAYDTVTGDWKAGLLDLSAQRARIGTEFAPDWANWRTDVYQVDLAGTVSWDELPASVTPEIGPYQTGTVYAMVTGVPDGMGIAWAFDSSSAVSWGGVAVQDERDTQTMGISGTFAAHGDGDIRVGAVNFASSDFDADDRIGTADVTIRLTQWTPEGGDTGTTSDGGTTADGGSTGDGGTSTGDGGTSTGDGGTSTDTDTGRPPLDRNKPDSGKGCSASGAASGLTEAALAWLITMGLVGWRRR